MSGKVTIYHSVQGNRCLRIDWYQPTISFGTLRAQLTSLHERKRNKAHNKGLHDFLYAHPRTKLGHLLAAFLDPSHLSLPRLRDEEVIAARWLDNNGSSWQHLLIETKDGFYDLLAVN